VAEISIYLIEIEIMKWLYLVGQILVSRIGNAEWTEPFDKEPKWRVTDTTKGVD